MGYPTAYQRADGYVHRKSGDRDVLICVGKNIANFNGYVLLNGTAAFLWEKLDQPRTLDQLTDQLLETFEVSREQARMDIAAMLEDFTQQGLIRLTDACEMN